MAILHAHVVIMCAWTYNHCKTHAHPFIHSMYEKFINMLPAFQHLRNHENTLVNPHLHIQKESMNVPIVVQDFSLLQVNATIHVHLKSRILHLVFVK